jgi:steroid delta-isomerase-like uncharacterized protein
MAERDSAGIGREWFESWNDRDFDRGAALAAADLELTQMPFGVTHQGPEGIRQFFEFWSGAFPDSKPELVNVVASEDGVTAEGIFRGTHEAPLQSPSGEIPATGRRVEVPHCFVFGIKGGKLAEGRLYFDVATLLQQLGVAALVEQTKA